MKKDKKLNIVLDANWYISACINRKSRRTLYNNIFKNPDIRIFYSNELMTEFNDVIRRPKFDKIITNSQVKRFQTIAFKFLRKITTEVVPDVVRDKDDNYLL